MTRYIIRCSTVLTFIPFNEKCRSPPKKDELISPVIRVIYKWGLQHRRSGNWNIVRNAKREGGKEYEECKTKKGDNSGKCYMNWDTFRYSDLVRCVLVPVAVSLGRLIWIPGSRHSCWALQDLHHQTSGGRTLVQTLLGKVRFIAWHQRWPFRGMPMGPEEFFVQARCV